MRLSERLTAADGVHYLPGMQALVRLPLEQARRDRVAGLRIGTFISGYPGSPLAGYDLQLARQRELLAGWDIRHVPAGNEEQAATAITGTQMLDGHPHSRYDGVTAFWYGKGPGVDRAGDALRHGNFAGTSRHGAVVLLSGEDHEAKSSTMPFQQEWAFVSAGIPIVYPSSVEEFVTLGLHAVAISRHSGCWVAMKLVSQLCDGGQTVGFAPVPVVAPGPFAKRADFSFFPGRNIEHERHLYEERHGAVLAYTRANALNRVLAGDGRVGIISAGKALADVRQALLDLGLELPLLALGLIHPLDEEAVRAFCAGLDEVIVVEEKRAFIEDAVRRAVQPLGRPLRVLGKRDADGRRMFPVEGGIDADLVAEILGRALRARAPRLAALAAIRAREHAVHEERSPNFCSGCPHSHSTVLAEGQVAWGSPGCNCFNTVIEQPERHVDTMTQFGGEGLPWIGLEHYTDREHIIQHVGDGSIYHSSYLNIRFAVAAGVSMTFKVLHNGAVANTGAQEAVGQRGVAALTRSLSAEGVARLVIASKEPQRYDRSELGERTTVRRADELVAAAVELERVPGVTVLIYDESCANERRRQQKRGRLPAPETFALINEAVCENCGDCGAKSNCMSLQKVDTELGPKTQIHSSSCNQDLACLQGDCPSFVTVYAPGGYRRPELPRFGSLPEPGRRAVDEPFHIYAPGVGGTGVITLNAMLAVAAQLDGLHALTYDQTGAAQKWGPVLSSLVLFAAEGQAHANHVGRGRADLYLALDELAAVSPANLERCDRGRTSLVVNTDLFPTGAMVRDVSHEVDRAGVADSLARVTRTTVAVPARTLAERLFGEYMATNVIALGAAYQAGLLPLTAASIEAAIRLNGVAVEANLAAFACGRQWVHDPGALQAAVESPQRRASERMARLGRRRARRCRELLARTAELEPELREALELRVADLVDYQSPAYAARYLARVLDVAHAERGAGGEGALAAAVARGLHKLMAYKDEYEVARLHLAAEFREQLEATFEGPVKLVYHLHPPLLRRFGRERKLALGPWFRGPLRVLRALRRVRGTPLDPFGRLSSRREERELITWYEDLLDRAVAVLDPATLAVAAELAALPDDIRGYEEIKSRNATKARLRARALLKRLDRPERVTILDPARGADGVQ